MFYYNYFCFDRGLLKMAISPIISSNWKLYVYAFKTKLKNQKEYKFQKARPEQGLLLGHNC